MNAAARVKAAARAGVPEWIAVGTPRDFAKPRAFKVHGRRLVGYAADDGLVLVADEACPHRGASLAREAARCGPDGLRCSYHGRCVSPSTDLERYLPCSELDGYLWVDLTRPAAGRGPSSFPIPPPTCPEFSSPQYRTISYTKRLTGFNPVVGVENLIDWNHLFFVHRAHVVDGDPVVRVGVPDGLHGTAEYAYDDPKFALVIENEFWAPFTTCLRFMFCDKRTGEEWPPLLLWLSVMPEDETTAVLHLRIARSVLKEFPLLTDFLFKAIDELPLREDADVVRQVDPSLWSANQLGPEDAFVEQYRATMVEHFLATLARYVA